MEDESDEEYKGSKHYWSKGWLGGAYQSYIDAIATIEKCSMSEEEKKELKEKVLDSRKVALGKYFSDFPPWCNN